MMSNALIVMFEHLNKGTHPVAPLVAPRCYLMNHT